MSKEWELLVDSFGANFCIFISFGWNTALGLNSFVGSVVVCEHVHKKYKHMQLSVAVRQNCVLQDWWLCVARPAVEIVVISVSMVFLYLVVAVTAISHLGKYFHVDQELDCCNLMYTLKRQESKADPQQGPHPCTPVSHSLNNLVVSPNGYECKTMWISIV